MYAILNSFSHCEFLNIFTEINIFSGLINKRCAVFINLYPHEIRERDGYPLFIKEQR